MTGITCLMVGGSTGTPSGRAASLPSAGINDSEFSYYPTTATTSVTFTAGGSWSTNPSGNTGTWLTGTGAGVNYEVYLDTSVSGGSFGGSAANTWLSLGSTRSWNVSTGVAGEILTESGTLKIRDATSLVQLTSCDLILTAVCNF